MSFLDFNKLAGAVLLAALFLMVIGVIGDLLVSPSEHGATDVRVAAREPVKKPAAKATALAPIGPLLASASAERGAKVFRKCAGCHAAAKGGRNKVGPNLWNVVNGARAAAGGYSYSKALKAKAGKWGYESLNAFLNKRAPNWIQE